MVIKRGSDGIPIELPTLDKTIKRSLKQPTSKIDLSILNKSDDKTVVLKKQPASPTEHAKNTDEERTVIRGAQPNRKHENSDSPPNIAMSDPPSGWLVVIAGPGKGEFVKLGFGQNSLGRDKTERVSLDFGDPEISRSNHATITYDPRSNKYFIQPGSGANLTYIEGEPTPVLQAGELHPNAHIMIGNTTLRFVPLCSDTFTWNQD